MAPRSGTARGRGSRRPWLLYEDTTGVYRAPRERVRAHFVSGATHAEAHRHRQVRRRPLGPGRGEYRWTQPFRGRRRRFGMRWTELPDLGWAYEVVAGPFRGSCFLLCHHAQGAASTRVALTGAFISPELSGEGLRDALRDFFDREFEEDRVLLEAGAEPPGARAAAGSTRRRRFNRPRRRRR